MGEKHMTFMNALKSKADKIQSERETEKQYPKAPEAFRMYTVTVDIVINKNRLDVFFSEKPSEQDLETMRNGGFHFRPKDKAWYHKDSKENREYLTQNLGIKFDTIQDAPQPAIAAPIASAPLAQSGNEEQSQDSALELSPDFIRYRKQHAELISIFNCDPIDLHMKAIDALYNATVC